MHQDGFVVGFCNYHLSGHLCLHVVGSHLLNDVLLSHHLDVVSSFANIPKWEVSVDIEAVAIRQEVQKEH